MSESIESLPVCAVVGVGPGNGEAFARRFAGEGHAVALLARRKERIDALAAELPNARAFACDVTDAASVQAAFAAIEAELGTSGGSDLQRRQGRLGRRGNCDARRLRGGVARQYARLVRNGASRDPVHDRGRARRHRRGRRHRLVARHGGHSGVRVRQGRPEVSAQSLARHLWPKGVHVSLIVVDGVVGGPETRKTFYDKPDDFFVKPTAVADIALALIRQDCSAWSFEVEARPFGEKW